MADLMTTLDEAQAVLDTDDICHTCKEARFNEVMARAIKPYLATHNEDEVQKFETIARRADAEGIACQVKKGEVISIAKSVALDMIMQELEAMVGKTPNPHQ